MRLFFFVLILHICLLQAVGQQPYFDHYKVEEGIANNQVFRVVQDDLGYVWLGTLNGLNRFDGYGFDSFLSSGNKAGALKGNIINSMDKGKNGNVWVVTLNGGLNHYNAITEKFYQFPDSIFPVAQSSIHNIIEDARGNIRFVANGKFFFLDVAKKEVRPLLDGTNIRSQFRYSDDISWLITSKGILFYDIKEDTLISTHESLAQLKNVVSVIRDPYYEIYILTFDGIYYFDEESLKLYSILIFKDKPGIFPRKNRFQKLASDGDNFWITYGHKLFRIFQKNSVFEIQAIENTPFNKSAFHGILIKDVFVDNDRNTWIGTNKYGVNLYDKRVNQFSHFYPYDLDAETRNLNPVRAICKAKSGKIWVGFENEGLGYFDQVKNKFYPYDLKGQSIGYVRAIFEDSRNNLWVGTNKGVYILDEKRNIFEKINKKLDVHSPYNAWAIKEDDDGKLWVGGLSLSVIDTKLERMDFVKQGEISGVRDLFFDHDDIWIATNNTGVAKLNLKTNLLQWYRSSETEESSLCDNKVYCICVQKEYVWAGTNYGLSRINKKTGEIDNFFEKDGLSSNVIYGCFSDEKDNLWISTAKGITHLNVRTLHFSKYLQQRFFLDDAYHNNRDKKIFLGGYNGFVSFEPEDIIPASPGQMPLIKKMFLLGEPVAINDPLNLVLDQSIIHTKKIELSYAQNTFSFELNALPVTMSKQASFKYILEGYQSKWVTTQPGDHRAVFTQVPPGNYTLRIQALKEDGTWGGVEKTLEIIITPPFWKTKLFNGILLVVIVLLVFALFKARERNIKRRNIQLQDEVEAKTVELKKQNTEIIKQKEEIEKMSEQVHEADQAKLRFFTNVSHELKTPLTLIMGHLEMINQFHKNGCGPSLHIVRRNALKLLDLVNDIVDFRKASQGELELNVDKYNCIALVREIVDEFKASAAIKKIDLQLLCPVDEIFLWLDKGKFEKVINNLISNAIKYTPSKGAILVLVEETDEEVAFHVKDTGVGILVNDQDKIFKRFYRSSSVNGEVGHGIGLALVKSIVELHRGVISIKSNPGEGSCFSVNLKKGKEHLPTERFVSLRHTASSRIKAVNFDYAFPKSSLSLIKTGLPSLLIVEDNPELLNFLCELLTDEYSIETAINGKDALRKIEQFQADLIISDIMMPEMDGITFCEKVKQDIRFSHIPFILLTAKSDLETRIEGFQLGIDDYIEKPFHNELIKVRISALLTNREKIKEEIRKGRLIVENENNIPAPDKVFLEKVWRIIENNFHNPDFSVEFLGREVGMSRATFFRKFKGLTGQSASDFIKIYRIQKAASLIKAGHNSVSEVYTLVGYQSASQFRKAFREEFEMSPSEYIKRS